MSGGSCDVSRSSVSSSCSSGRCRSVGGGGRGVVDSVCVGGESSRITAYRTTTDTTRNSCSRTDVHTHADTTFNDPVDLDLDLLTSGSMRAERLPWSICLASLVLTAQSVSLQSLGHKDTQTHKATDTTDHATHALDTDKLDKYIYMSILIYSQACSNRNKLLM